MALSASTVWEIRTTATAGNANGGGFVTGASGTDYSQQDAAQYNLTGVSTSGADAILLTASAAADMVGNIAYISAGTNFTVGRYEILSVSVGVSITLDRNCTTAAGSNGVVAIGGALSLGSSDDAVFEAMVAGNIAHVKSGTYTIGGTVSISSAGSATKAIEVRGYSSTRNDAPLTTGRPVFNFAATVFTVGAQWYFRHMIFTGTSNPVVQAGNHNTFYHCKFLNTSTTANRPALSCGSFNNLHFCEFISYRGHGLSVGSSCFVYGCHAHSSANGIYDSTTNDTVILNCLVHGCVTNGIWFDAAGIIPVRVIESTVYGWNTPLGTGIRCDTGARNITILNNIISGFATGILHDDAGQTVVFENFNCLYNNTANTSNHTLGTNTITTDPGFSSVGYLSGSTATTSGSVLTQSGGDFSTVVDGQDFLYLVSGTGITAGIYGITSHTATTLTLDIAPGTSAVADKTWRIVTGKNFAVGANAKSVGAPAALANTQTSNYLDLGAAQSQYGLGSAGGGGSRSAGLGHRGIN